MELREYLKAKGISNTDFSKTLGCDRAYLSRILNKRDRPSKFLAAHIARHTEGNVSVEEIMAPYKNPLLQKDAV